MKPRTLVLCFDGTSNEYDADNTNVVKLFALLKRDDFNQQICLYQPGIGTYYNPGAVSPLLDLGAKYLDYAFAWYLDAHVMDGYKFLMKNYRVGDKICLFGFSRGAYVARALAGFLYKIGLLPKDNEAQVPLAFKLYKREDHAGLDLCVGFKQTYCQDVKVEFVGVWDTVASVGLVSGRTLPFTNSNKAIKFFRHALSLDEHRGRFRPNYFHRAPADPRLASKRISQGKRSSDSSSSASGEVLKVRGNVEADDVGELDDVQEVWFSGCHCDVGGGAVANDTPNSLANITLRWMVRQIMLSGCGIQFDDAALERAKICRVDPATYTTPSVEEITLDKEDSVQPLHDSLVKYKIWWLLEMIPLHYYWQDAKTEWHKEYGVHFGRGRLILDPQPRIHTTVKQRMSSSLNYVPKAIWAKGSEVYVV